MRRTNSNEGRWWGGGAIAARGRCGGRCSVGPGSPASGGHSRSAAANERRLRAPGRLAQRTDHPAPQPGLHVNQCAAAARMRFHAPGLSGSPLGRFVNNSRPLPRRHGLPGVEVGPPLVHRQLGGHPEPGLHGHGGRPGMPHGDHGIGRAPRRPMPWRRPGTAGGTSCRPTGPRTAQPISFSWGMVVVRKGWPQFRP